MSCNHEYTNQEGRALEKLVAQLEQQLAAANNTIDSLTGHIEHIDGQLAAANAKITEQAATIEAMKCCGNCVNWRNRPEKMSCKLHEIDVAQWCRCGEWQVKEGQRWQTEL